MNDPLTIEEIIGTLGEWNDRGYEDIDFEIASALDKIYLKLIKYLDK